MFLLHKEKELESSVRRTLPAELADSVRPSGFRLAHLYDLPKTHKEQLAMRPTLSATKTYHYALAKWLGDKLKPLAANKCPITDTFKFVNEGHDLRINSGDFLVFYDVSSLFTNVPLDETISILADKAFANDWFMKHKAFTSPSRILSISLEVQLRTNFFCLMGNFTSRQTVSRWAPPLDPYWPMFSCVAALKKPWSVKARCPLTIGDTWTTL